MSPRRIRVAGVRADFITPRGWPTPTDAWIRENAFWQPPPGWTPLPGLCPAPEGWRFWAPNKAWQDAAAEYFRSARRWATIANFATVGWLAAGAAAVILNQPALRAAAIVCAAIAIVSLTISEVTKHRLSRRMVATMADAATDHRSRRLTREYQRYLGDAS